MLEKEIIQYYTDHEDEIIAKLSELIAIESSFGTPDPDNGRPFGEGPAKALEWVQKFGQEIGLHTRNIDNYAVAMDWAETEPVLAILSHADVVPADPAEWTTDPLELDVRDGNIYGRGTVDDKGPTVAVMYAIKCLKDLGVKLNTVSVWWWAAARSRAARISNTMHSVSRSPIWSSLPMVLSPCSTAKRVWCI